MKTKLKLMDPRTMKTLASHKLPARPGTAKATLAGNMRKVFKDTSGGSYFFVDHKNRATLVTAKKQVVIIGKRKQGNKWKLVREKTFDLKPYVPSSGCGAPGSKRWNEASTCEKVTSTLPDWQGRLWFTSRQGRIGVIDPRTGKINVVRLSGEKITNSFSIDERGVYIISNRKMYLYRADAQGRPQKV